MATTNGQKPLPQITCPKCFLVQDYRGQTKCIHRGCEWTTWDVAVQLGRPGTANIPSTRPTAS